MKIIIIIGTVLYGIVLIGFALFLLIQGIKENKELDNL